MFGVLGIESLGIGVFVNDIIPNDLKADCLT